MKSRVILFLLVLISVSSFGRKRYNLSKEDFINQFNESQYLNKVYCQNNLGETVWLFCNENTILNIVFKDSIRKKIMLQKTKLKQGIIETVNFSIWWPRNKIVKYDFNKVVEIYIEQKYQEDERPYFDIDSVRIECKKKNDSLRNHYNYEIENYILLIEYQKNSKDTIRIIENACYNITFIDGVQTKIGVVNKITNDSIFITNYFNSKIALKSKMEFIQLGYSIKELKSISLHKSGGYGYKEIEIVSRNIIIKNRSRDVSNMPYWFTYYVFDGEIRLYRIWLKENGYFGISEQDGRAVWYEGGSY